ncbi:MAG: cytochrome c [Chloracidobacterium sp.]|nr:cytochrome c [Chloracidobacterium sp.]
MFRAKLLILIIFAIFGIASCFSSKPPRYSIANSKDYAASMFRQHCAICHGPEGEGRTLPDGKVVPNMREGQLKFRTEAEIYKQLSEGGNGMTPFRDQLTKRELDLMTKFIHDELRKKEN